MGDGGTDIHQAVCRAIHQPGFEARGTSSIDALSPSKPRNGRISSAAPTSPPPRRPPTRQRQILLLLLLLLLLLCTAQLMHLLFTSSEIFTDSSGGLEQLLGAGALAQGVIAPNWRAALAYLKRTTVRYVVINAKNGLGNRLRALASAMSVAEYAKRPVLLIWMADLHLNCSFSGLFEQPLPFTLLEEEIPVENLTSAHFQVFNYMRPEPGAVKDEFVDIDPDRHLYFRSAFVMNHAMGEWRSGGPQRQLRRLQPVRAVQSQLVADHSMVGLHVRNVFDAPRSVRSNASTEGSEAMESAKQEYGSEGTLKLLQWRRASHWTNFVPRMITMMREWREMHSRNSSEANLRFYLAADSEDAYSGLTRKFPNRLLYTRRDCAAKRCDFRDCR